MLAPSSTRADCGCFYICNGVNFVVGPLLNADVAKVCNRRKIPYSPGLRHHVGDQGNAEELGCEIVKIFPGNSVGRSGVRQVRGAGAVPVDPH